MGQYSEWTDFKLLRFMIYFDKHRLHDYDRNKTAICICYIDVFIRQWNNQSSPSKCLLVSFYAYQLLNALKVSFFRKYWSVCHFFKRWYIPIFKRKCQTDQYFLIKTPYKSKSIRLFFIFCQLFVDKSKVVQKYVLM